MSFSPSVHVKRDYMKCYKVLLKIIFKKISFLTWKTKKGAVARSMKSSLKAGTSISTELLLYKRVFSWISSSSQPLHSLKMKYFSRTFIQFCYSFYTSVFPLLFYFSSQSLGETKKNDKEKERRKRRNRRKKEETKEKNGKGRKPRKHQ